MTTTGTKILTVSAIVLLVLIIIASISYSIYTSYYCRNCHQTLITDTISEENEYETIEPDKDDPGYLRQVHITTKYKFKCKKCGFEWIRFNSRTENQ